MPSRLARGSLVALVAGLVLLGAPARAAPPGDDWSIERSDRDPALLDQRFEKLRRRPWDAPQWRALEIALGRPGLARRIDSARDRSPSDPALIVLKARMLLREGRPRDAAALLADLKEPPRAWQKQLRELRIEAHLAAGDPRGAIALLEAAGEPKALTRALDLAADAQLSRDQLRLARVLAERAPSDPRAQLRLARAAESAKDLPGLDAAYSAVERLQPARERPRIRREWAEARIRLGALASAVDLLWVALEDPATPAAERPLLWAALADAHTRDAQAELSPARLERRLAEPRYQKEAAAWRALARIQAAYGADAAAAWQRALSLAPRDLDAQSALLAALDAAGDNDAALAEFRRLGGGSAPERAQQGLTIAGRMITDGHRELGLGLAAEIEAAAGKQTATLLSLLDFFNLHEAPDRALAVAERLVAANPRDPEARITLGEQLYQMNRKPEALREWAKLPNLIRPAHRGWARHAEILAEHRDPEAINSLDRALSAAPHEPNYLRLKAILLQESRVPGRALTTWQELLVAARAPQHRQLRDEARTRVVELLVGNAFGKASTRRVSAEDAARAALAATDPEASREAALFLAELYTREERHGDAVAIQERLLLREPDDPERLAALALAQRRAGRSADAMATLERLITADPQRSGDILLDLAELAFDAGQHDRALDFAERLAAAGVDSSRAFVRIGELHERRGDSDAASSTYARALTITADDPLARLRLAELSLARGRADAAAAIFRAIVERGGPPEIVQQAGRRALDLAEASGDAIQIVDLALARGRREPLAEDPRELLLDALDRSDEAELRAWLAAGDTPPRRPALSRALIHILTRDPVGMRLRAADHLGRQTLPGAGLPLARMGAQLTPPQGAPRAVKDAFNQARASALFAAGQLDEPEAIPFLEQAARGGSGDVRYAATWALAQSNHPAAHATLPSLLRGHDPPVRALICLALARTTAPDPHIHGTVAQIVTSARNRHERLACALAERLLAPPGSAAPIAQMSAADPVLAAIAAWHLGSDDLSPASVEALLGGLLGPAGLPRDAAASALAALLHSTSRRSLAPLPRLRSRGWETSLERWLTELVAPVPTRPIPAGAVAPHLDALARAIKTASAGTRAERDALAEHLRPCDGAPATSRGLHLCLEPWVQGTITLDPAPPP
jgi:tetratricopeptide (TPR) repeat protein